MNKTKKFLLVANIQKLIGFIFLLICLLIPFASAITLNSGSISKQYGPAFSFIFGSNIVTKGAQYTAHSISPLALIAYILIMISFVLIIFSCVFIKKKANLSKWFVFISSLLIIVSSIMFITCHRSIASVLSDALISSHSDTVSNTIYENSKLNFGIYGIAIFGFISSLLLLASLVFDGTLDKVRAKVGII